MTRRGQTLLKGHALRREGQAFIDDRGVLLAAGATRGCALCECGATSPVLDSNAARKRWHRDHKAEVAAA